MLKPYSIKPVGSCAALVCFAQEVSEAIHGSVLALDAAIKAQALRGIVETVPSFSALLVRYDPYTTDYEEVSRAIDGAAGRARQNDGSAGRTVEIPVCYGGRYGEDLDFIARHAHLSPQEVIRLHSGRTYRIYMLGFLPGFPYLGGLDERLYTPRLQNPRTRIPAGSVGIGGKQTGLYPLESPGGWQLLGRTPLRLFRPEDGGRLPYAVGDRIRFVPIDEATFEHIAAQQQTGGAAP